MSGRAKATILGSLVGAAGFVAVLAAVGFLVVYTGSFNVAATEEHPSFIRWAFDTTFRNSVERRAAELGQPEKFTPAMIAAGGADYRAMCEHCHAGPGHKRADWASGMRPRPPHLVEAAVHWTPREVFWLAKHGVKMTGMPAFGPTHDDRTLWNIAAFVKELPAMTPQRYAELTGVRDGASQGAQGH